MDPNASIALLPLEIEQIRRQIEMELGEPVSREDAMAYLMSCGYRCLAFEAQAREKSHYGVLDSHASEATWRPGQALADAGCAPIGLFGDPRSEDSAMKRCSDGVQDAVTHLELVAKQLGEASFELLDRWKECRDHLHGTPAEPKTSRGRRRLEVMTTEAAAAAPASARSPVVP